ncbi:hypothetical protein FNW02_24860 [Komarekiella sp. 'clone 1']|uniref:Uncharacterized protein n=1 Tax=Komarekiella delphini-convector SJRDD-AB1 TaxID=2593771 RepID=A0AA40T0Y6_9NOST|nr:hypothetical protein [Komarekiella delphini-convector]MBD6618964.1 hypothetical protein [Komarekiella delphini-convector SJRDD-AB1]
MGHKYSLNNKRLTKKQVQELIESEGKLHEDFTQLFEETYSTGHKNQPLVYKLPNDRFLFVFDPKGYNIPGKGDIFTKEYFLKYVQWTQRVRENIANNRANSVSHWRYYSKHKIEIVNKIDDLINELGEKLQITHAQLDFSYMSLDVVSKKAEAYEIDKILTDLYDNLVAYVGEIIMHRKNGQWTINSNSSIEKYPYISAGVNGVLMPINVVWQELTDMKPIDLRKETANEIRRFSLNQR